MKRIDFYEKKKSLHNEMVEAIVALFARAGITEIDFRPKGEWEHTCYVTLSTDGADSTREVRVSKVKVEDGEPMLYIYDEDWWVWCEHGGEVVTCTLDDVYDSVYEYVSNLSHTYYVCQLDSEGKPTGKITKESWTIRVADHMKEKRGYIYNDFHTALLHAQYGDKG